MNGKPHGSSAGYGNVTPVNLALCNNSRSRADVQAIQLDKLKKLSNEGCEPAKKSFEAFKKFQSVFNLIRNSSSTTLKSDDTLQSRILIDLASALRADSKIPAWTPSELAKLSTVISLVVERQNPSTPSELDKSIRICQLYFLSLNNPVATLALAIESSGKYPMESYFYVVHCSMLGFLGKMEKSAQVATKALVVFPTNLDLLYIKASSLKHAGGSPIEEQIEALQAFLHLASKSERHVPQCHYDFGLLIATDIIPESKSCKVFTRGLNTVKKAIKNGEDAEKYMLPHHLEDVENFGPLNAILKLVISKAESKMSTFLDQEDQKARKIILNHRSLLYFADASKSKEIAAQLTKIHISSTKSEIPSSNFSKLLKYTSIEPAVINVPKPESNVNLSLVLQQSFYGEIIECQVSNFDLTKFDQEIQQRDIHELFGIGCKITLANVFKNGGRIFINNPCPDSLIFHVKERLDRPCYYCGIEDAPMQCVKCKVALYCDRHCQKRDWKFFDHRKICTNMVKSNVA